MRRQPIVVLMRRHPIAALSKRNVGLMHCCGDPNPSSNPKHPTPEVGLEGCLACGPNTAKVYNTRLKIKAGNL